MELQRIVYEGLSPKQQELYNFHKAAAVLADYGFHCVKLADDWEGADFLACHNDGRILKVQLKGRLHINGKYLNKGLYMVFPSKGHWYFTLHDELVRHVSELTEWLDQESWTEKGVFHSASPRQELLDRLYRLGARPDC